MAGAAKHSRSWSQAGGGSGITKKGSVRKRLSMLKLGGKKSKGDVRGDAGRSGAVMGSLDEE